MALQLFPNRVGQLLLGGPNASYGQEVPLGYGSRVMDAVGESVFGIGRLVWADGGSHTVSSAGGKMTVNFQAATFNNAGTTLRAGIQDVSSGLEDGTFDVYDDLIGGTDAISAGLRSITFSNGSKVIASGALVAVGCEMTTRGGADTVTLRTIANTTASHPYVSADTGAGPTRVAVVMQVLVEADDGTVGWILGAPLPYVDDTVSLSEAGTPDEIALIFTLPVPARVQIPVAYVTPQAGDTFEFRLYTDPLGTPTQQRSVAVDPNETALSANVNPVTGLFSTTYDLAANTPYAIAVRATGSIFTLSRMGVLAAAHRAATLVGTNWSYGSRSNDTGAFTEVTDFLPRIGLYLQALDDGAGGGGSSGGAFILGGTVVR